MARLVETAASVDAARYGPIAGGADLRAAYAGHLAALSGGDIAAANVAITAGCNMGVVVALMLVAKAGDAIVLPSPWYFNHEMTAKMLGIAARPLPCDPHAGFVPTPDAAERLIDARTRAIVLVTPNNPTGAIYPERVIHAFADLCRRRGLWLVIDETYRDFLPPSHGRARPLRRRRLARPRHRPLQLLQGLLHPGLSPRRGRGRRGGDQGAVEDPRLHPDLRAADRPARARLGHRGAG